MAREVERNNNGAEFVVIDHLQSLQDVQTDLRSQLGVLRSQLEVLKECNKVVERVVQYQNALWHTLGTFILFVVPMLFGMIVYFKMTALAPEAREFRDSIGGLLLSFSLCVMLPIFLVSLYDFKSARDQLESEAARFGPRDQQDNGEDPVMDEEEDEEENESNNRNNVDENNNEDEEETLTDFEN